MQLSAGPEILCTNKQMDRKVKNIKELAAQIGISATTVSRVLNGKAELYRISPATSKKVLDAANKFSYYPDRIARGLRLKKTETLGLIIPDIANPFFSSIAKTIEIETRSKGYSLILGDSLDDIQTETELLNLFAGRKADGIILAPVGQSSKHIEEFQKRGIPVMVIDRYLPGTEIPFITTDNYAGAFEAVQYMISKGHRIIACIQGLNGISVNTDRVQGYRDALEQNNIKPDSSLIVGDDFGEENGYNKTRFLLSRRDPPTAILALSNLISLGAMRAIAETGLKIPDDISIISFDDQPYSALLACPMTTVEQSNDKIAVIAVNMLLDIITGRKKENEIENIMIRPRLIIRKSVKKT